MPTKTEINNDEWGTPLDLFNKLDAEFYFTLDPCASTGRPLRDDITQFTKEDNGLSQPWTGHRVFCNPPYSSRQIRDWVMKAYAERDNCQVIVLLIPVRTDRAYFHDFIQGTAEIRFLRGRPKFIPLMNQNGGSPSFPSMLVIYQSKCPDCGGKGYHESHNQASICDCRSRGKR